MPISEADEDMPSRDDDQSMTVREALADLALERVLSSKQIKAINLGKVRTIAVLVPALCWVDPIATAFNGWCPDASLFRRSNTKGLDDDAGLAKLRLATKSVVFVATSAASMPKWFATSAQSVLEVPGIDGPMVRALMRRFCSGRVPKGVDALDLEKLDFDEVAALVAPGAGVSATVERFREAIARKSRSPVAERLPDFVEAVEYGDAHSWGLELKKDLDDYRRGMLDWQDVDRGIILAGPPGTGKTLYAKALASYLGVPLIQTNLAELFSGSSGYLDAIVRAQRQAFEQARAIRPSLMFIDELDQIPNLDSVGPRNKDYWSVVVADFLMALDGSDEGRDGVVVIGATNRPAEIAPSIKRKGRLEREVFIGPPGPTGIERIIRHHARGDLDDADLNVVSRVCHGRQMTASDLMELVRVGRRMARRNERRIEASDLMSALLPINDWPEDAMRRIAVHEAGHCLVGLMLSPGSLSSVTLSIDFGSFTSFGLRNIQIVTSKDLAKQQAILLAGRQAEMLVYGDVGTGSGGSSTSDLAKASALAASIRVSYGMAGPQWWAEPDDVYALLRLDPTLRAAVDRDLAETAQEVDRLLMAGKAALLALSEALLEQRYLDVETMRSIVAGTGLDLAA